MDLKEEDIIKDAMIATEKEIFSNAFGEDEAALDESGDRSLESMGDGLEGQNDPDEDDDLQEEDGEESGEDGQEDNVEAEGEGEQPEASQKDKESQRAPTDVDAQNNGRVPSGKLREANDAKRAAEAERDTLKAQLDQERATARQQIDALSSKFDGILAALQRQQPIPQGAQPGNNPAAPANPEPEQVPDILLDPEGYMRHVEKTMQRQQQQFEQQLRTSIVDNSLRAAHGRYGDTFSQAFSAVKSLDPNSMEGRETVRRIYNSSDPGEALVQWHKRNEVLRQVGDDPARYREQVQNETREALMNDPEFRRQLIEDLRAEAATGDQGRPRTATRLPKSLNSVSGNNAQRRGDTAFYDDSPAAGFNSAWQ